MLAQIRYCVREGDVPDLDIIVAPLVEQLDAADLVGDLLREDGIAGWALDLDFAVRHDCDWAERRLGLEVERQELRSVVVASLKCR